VTALLQRAVGRRHGIVPGVEVLPTARCEVPGVWHASVGPAPEAAAGAVGPPAGGVGWSAGAACDAAVGEALERYAAAVCPLPAVAQEEPSLPLEAWSLFSEEQRASPAYPFAAAYRQQPTTFVWDLADNRRWTVPRALVGLADPAGHGLVTSSGLAAAPSRPQALLRATQELVERDALMTVWNWSLPGRRVALPARYEAVVADVAGRATAVDATPAYSPHPVALVFGEVRREGRRRIALGAACRATWEEAVGKAFLEWAQGILFAGVWCAARPGLRYDRPAAVRTFEDHAAYYTAHPDHWDAAPLAAAASAPGGPPPPDGPPSLAALVAGLTGAGVRLLYRDLTTPDVAQVGVAVVRVLSPDLTPIGCEHAWPFLGGRAADVAWRYPGAMGALATLNPWPHPLG
jgi:ribosomal protein S12 methylthiotransferase accessory factor